MSKNTNLSFLTDYITADITNGRIGINNASPAFAFDVSGTARVSTSLNINTASSGYTTPSLLVNAGAGAAIPLQAIADSTGGRLFRFYTSDFNNTTTGTSIRLNFGAATGNTSANLQVYTGGEQVVAGTILALQPSGGNVGIGTSSPSDVLELKSASANNPNLRLYSTFNAGASAYGINWYRDYDSVSNTIAGYIRYNRGGGSDGDMLFGTGTNAGVSERMRITSDGNVLIGTTTGDGYKLQIVGATQASVTFGQTYATVAAYSQWITSSGAFAMGLDGGAGTTERMRITSSGEVLVGTTTVTGSTTGSAVNTGTVIHGSTGTLSTQRNNETNIYLSKASGFTDGGLINFFTQGINRGSITTNGVNTAYNTSSDYRLKEDLKDYNGLNIISKLKTYDFKWKDTNIRDYGVMAHELQEVLPNYVNGDKDAINDDGTIKTQGVDYSKIVPVLVKAIQELSAENTSLINRIEALENK